MPDWDATLYRRFEDERTRPAADLLARVGARGVSLAVDLGCGPGNSTELLVHAFPGAEILGVDTSPAMLEAARVRLPEVGFTRGDVATWTPPRPPEVVFANAVLQWVPDHPRLYPRLIDQLAPGGWLAVQVPDNFDEPSHTLMRDVAAAMGRADVIAGAETERTPIGSVDDHYRWLAPVCRSVDLWSTTYAHVLDGVDAIVAWLSSTGLRPYLSRLDAPGQREFLDRYRAAIAGAYPVHADGKVLLRFPRRFVVAQR